jgi:HrpA-like RNA helicase
VRGKNGFFDIEMEDRLPIYKNEFEIMDSINTNLVTVISGETGTGKST